MNCNKLNSKFSLNDELFIEDSRYGWPCININNTYASAIISLYAGQVLSYRPHGQKDCLFISDRAYLQAGKAIKGGIPVCWPWFGDDPEERNRAAHGFVRNRSWTLVETSGSLEGATQVKLGLRDTEETRTIWPYRFNLELTITIGETLALSLCTRNTDGRPLNITQALHSYLSVGNISKVRLKNLNGTTYLDKAQKSDSIKHQQGPVFIHQEIDRIYTDIPDTLYLTDESLQRVIEITSSGSNSTVVWNPWKEISHTMIDLSDESYRHFLCVETANAASDKIEILPQMEHRLAVEYRIQSLAR